MLNIAYPERSSFKSSLHLFRPGEVIQANQFGKRPDVRRVTTRAHNLTSHSSNNSTVVDRIDNCNRYS